MRRPLEIEAIDPWEESNVGIDEELPVFGTTAPRERLGQGVAGNAGARDGLAGHALVNHAMFGKILDRLSLFRRESLLITKVAKNFAGIVGLEGDALKTNHALDGFFPAFRSRASPGDAGHVAFGIRSMACAAFAYDQRIFDREAVFARRLGRLGSCRGWRVLWEERTRRE